MSKITDTPRIYVADLAAYNAGYLHGVWLDATDGLDVVMDEIQRMLEQSPVRAAEEYVIHDYEGFGGLQLSEFSGIAEAVALAEFLAEYTEYGAALLSHWDQDIPQATQALEDYAGAFDSLADFAQDLTEQTGDIPKHLEYYIDYERMACDMEMSGDVYALQGSDGHTHVFWNR